MALAILAGTGSVQADHHMPTLPMPELTDDGTHAQKWFYTTSLDLRKDLAAGEPDGRRLVILWEQRDCLYCKPMYEINLRIPRVVEKIKNNFNVIKMNIWGERKVTDLDGTILSEEELARKFKINFTPTLQFLPDSLEKAAGRSGKDSEDFRFEGYFKPFHFYFLFHYVQTGGYASEPNFQRWLGEIGRDLQDKSIKYDLWADALPQKLPNKY
jgi:thioredoxin-related protein